MTTYANGGSYSDSLIRSLRSRSRGAGHQSTDTSHAPPRSDSRLATAVAVSSTQVGRRLEGQRLRIETGHRTLKERLQRILAEVDRPTPGQSEAPRARRFSAIGHDQAEGGPLQRSHVHARPAHVIKLKPRADLQIARCSAMYFRQQSGCGSLVRVAPEQGVVFQWPL